jgi:hypothetical protein
MSRSAFLCAAALVSSVAFSSVVVAQTAKATPATPAGATGAPARAKFVPLVKGLASIEVIEGSNKRVGNDIVTAIKVKNVSTGSIGLLRGDVLWYDKDLKLATGASEVVRRAILPGEVVEMTFKSPFKPNLYRSQYAFSHAGGKITAKGVKKFSE